MNTVPIPLCEPGISSSDETLVSRESLHLKANLLLSLTFAKYVFVSFEYTAYRDSNAGMTTDANIVRGSTQIYENHECLGSTLGTGATGYQQTFEVCNFNY